jgi:hypothetical protein
MRKRTVIIVCVILILCAGAGTAYAVSTIQDKQPVGEDPVGRLGSGEERDAFISGNVKGSGAGALDVPVYFDSTILEDNDYCFELGRDSGYYKDFSSHGYFFDRIEALFPSRAIRQSDDGNYIYVMYDTEREARIFLFFSKGKDDYFALSGFPVVMERKLEYSEFTGLQVGDSISEVIAVDPVADRYRQHFELGNDIYLENLTQRGAPPTSIHLLSDGILKIEYTRNSDDDYAITNLVYSPDFVVDGLDGKTCYLIAEVDYVD